MRKFILTLLILSYSLTSSAQGTQGDPRGSISFGLFQDVALALWEDDNGIEPFTLDFRVEVMLQGNQQDVGFMVLGVTYEYADLADFHFIRYGVQGGYTFNQLSLFGLFDIEVTPMVGAGIIHRDPTPWISLEASIDFTYRVTDWFAINVKPTMMQRGDLTIFNDKSANLNPFDWKPNVYAGVKFYIN
jgi:hypothetical protein